MIADKRANYLVKISGIEIHPDPIEGGKPAQFKILATAGKSLALISFMFAIFSHMHLKFFLIVTSIFHFYNLRHVSFVTHFHPWI